MLPARSKNSRKLDLAGNWSVGCGTVGRIFARVAGLGSSWKCPKMGRSGIQFHIGRKSK